MNGSFSLCENTWKMPASRSVSVNNYLQKGSMTARKAVRAKDWATVRACAKEIIGRQRDSAEGHFLQGLAEKAANRPEQAIKSFSRALGFDADRYDAAVEMAAQYLRFHRYGDAAELLGQYETYLENSPVYLDMAGTIYTNIGLPEKGWPLYRKANELQPGIPILQENFAACNVYVGKIDEAKAIYRALLEKAPDHQRNHYELSRLGRAMDGEHVEQMLTIVEEKKLRPEKNIYIYYALGKELEDLERWDESFDFYKKAGDAAASVGNYDVQADVRTIDKVTEVCNAEWLGDGANGLQPGQSGKTPVFIVGLPRSGTTLTERILASHSQVESIGESFFMQIVLKQISGDRTADSMSAAIVEAAAKKDARRIADGYMEAIAYRFGNKPLFIEKFPENFLYLGFIAKAFPEARIIHLNRNPMDNCFALYKQSFFRYAYTLDDLGIYYAAYKRLHEHWRKVLGDRMLEIDYEALVSDQERQTRSLLDAVGLDFEAACLRFEQNKTASNTASSVQIREKIHVRSVNRWKCYEQYLQPLRNYLEKAGIDIE
jgi:tetratricopeptide (TPR) repeat protein